MTGETTVLELSDIDRAFGSVAVLQDVSFSVDSGEFVAVVGPNGSGKTTLLRIVTGLLAPDSGTVVVPEESERPVGFLPQHPSLRASLTVGETVDFYRELLEAPADTGDVLALVGLEDVPERRVDALSGGMRQLLGVGLATLGDPPLVVLDEPTGSLDPRNTQHIFDVVTRLTADGTAVLLSTHKLEYLRRADRLLVVTDGQLLVDIAPAELRERTTAESLTEAFHSLLGAGHSVQVGEPDE